MPRTVAARFRRLREGLQRPVGLLSARVATVRPGQHLFAHHSFAVAGHADGTSAEETPGSSHQRTNE